MKDTQSPLLYYCWCLWPLELWTTNQWILFTHACSWFGFILAKKHSSSDAATAFSWSVNLGTVNLKASIIHCTYSRTGRPLQDYHTCFLSLQYDEQQLCYIVFPLLCLMYTIRVLSGALHMYKGTQTCLYTYIVLGQHNCDACAAHLIGTGNILVIDFTPDHSIAVWVQWLNNSINQMCYSTQVCIQKQQKVAILAFITIKLWSIQF